jgi:putative DNA primase/helicase
LSIITEPVAKKVQSVTDSKAPPEPQADDGLDFETLAELRGDGDGPLDHPCPLCGPERRSEYNQTRATLRTWEPSPGFITYYCVRCEAKGWARGNARQALRPRAARAQPPPRDDAHRLIYVEQLWRRASPVLPASVVAYFRWRGIDLGDVPQGVLRYHASPKQPCIVARYSDAITGAPKGIWRRPLDGGKPTTLGPMGGCAIRLFPEIGDKLVIAEGVETALSAAQFTHRGELLRPVWATGCAGNMKRFPVLGGVKRLVIIVDNDASGTGQAAAEACARRWCDAGRDVLRLIPRKPNTDFNDLVRP